MGDLSTAPTQKIGPKRRKTSNKQRLSRPEPRDTQILPTLRRQALAISPLPSFLPPPTSREPASPRPSFSRICPRNGTPSSLASASSPFPPLLPPCIRCCSWTSRQLVLLAVAKIKPDLHSHWPLGSSTLVVVSFSLAFQRTGSFGFNDLCTQCGRMDWLLTSIVLLAV